MMLPCAVCLRSCSLAVRRALTLVRLWRRRRPARRRRSVQISVARAGQLRQRRRRCCAPTSSRPTASTGVTFFVDGRQVCALTRRRSSASGTPGQRSRRTRCARSPRSRRRADRPDGAHQGGRLRRARSTSTSCRSRSPSPTTTAGSSAACRSRRSSVFEDGQPQTITHFASEDVPLELVVAVDITGSMAPAMPKLKKAVKEFLGAVPAQDQVTLLGFNDSDLHADAQDDRSGRARQGGRSAGAVGLDRALRRDAARRRDARPPDRPQGAGRLQRRRGPGQPRDASNDVERRLQASDVTLYMIAQGRGVTMEPLKKIMERLTRADRRPRALHRQHRRAARRVRRAARRAVEPVPARLPVRPTPSATTRGGRSRSRSTATTNVRARQGYRALAGKLMTIEETAEIAEIAEKHVLGLVLCVLCVRPRFSLVRAAPQPPTKPRFQSSVEVTSLDVSVVDDKGKPITDLTPADFRSGSTATRAASSPPNGCRSTRRPRPATRAAAARRLHHATKNATGGRLIVIAVDQPNIRFGGALAIRKAANDFIDRLQPSDRVAVAGIGLGAPRRRSPPTRARIKQAIARMVGQQTAGACRSTHNIALVEALAIEQRRRRRARTVVSA